MVNGGLALSGADGQGKINWDQVSAQVDGRGKIVSTLAHVLARWRCAVRSESVRMA